MKNPVLVALDVPDLHSATSLARRLESHVGGFKVGLELLMNEGPSAVAEIAGFGAPVFAGGGFCNDLGLRSGCGRFFRRGGRRFHLRGGC